MSSNHVQYGLIVKKKRGGGPDRWRFDMNKMVTSLSCFTYDFKFSNLLYILIQAINLLLNGSQTSAEKVRLHGKLGKD